MNDSNKADIESILRKINACFSDIEACIERDDPKECLTHIKRLHSFTERLVKAVESTKTRPDDGTRRKITASLKRALNIYEEIGRKVDAGGRT